MAGAVASAAIASKIMKKKAEKTTYKAEVIEPVEVRKMSFYEKYVKRSVDVICATGAIVVFSPLYLGVAILVKTKLGSPVLFTHCLLYTSPSPPAWMSFRKPSIF